MANDKTGKEINLSGMLHTIRPTTLGKKAPDLTLKVAEMGARLFRVEDGEIKVPRKRRGVDDTQFAWLNDLKEPQTLYVYMEDPSNPNTAVQVHYDAERGEYYAEDEETGDRTWYDADSVLEMGTPDARIIKGSTEAINKLQAAVTRFNNKTGKKVVVRFLKDTRDPSGRTIEAEREVYRTR